MRKSDKMLEEIAKPIWNEYCRIYPKLKSFEMPVIRFDGRLTKVAGLNYDTENLIKIPTKLFNKDALYYTENIIPHELAHQVRYNLYGYTEEQHCRFWLKIRRESGFRFNRIASVHLWRK